MSLSKSMILAVAAVVVAMLVKGGVAQTGCTVALMSLSPCLSYVGGNSSSPSTSCCSSLSSVVGSQPQCLCTLLNGGGSSLGVAVNQTLALALPGACRVQTPPLSRCSAVNGSPTSAPAPADADADAPSGSPDGTLDVPTTPTVTDTPSGAGSKTVPTTDGSSNSAGSNEGAKMGVVVLMASLWAIS